MRQIHTFPVFHRLLVQLQHRVELLQTGLFCWAPYGEETDASHPPDRELRVWQGGEALGLVDTQRAQLHSLHHSLLQTQICFP